MLLAILNQGEIDLIDWNRLQRIIGVNFHDQSLLQQAFVHSSYVNENPDFSLPDNERLEFLGDALLSFIIAEKLYCEFPHFAEGKLTEIRISLIRRETLAQLASELGLSEYLYLSKGEELTGGRQRQTNLADAFEALLGAIFIDQGIAVARDFILGQMDSHFEEIRTGGIGLNHKALLQEFTQAEYKQLPIYQIVETSGPDHDKAFTVEVLIEGKVLGTGSGKSKRSAEMEAARSAWEKLKAE